MVKIITDSSALFEENVVEELGIAIVPLRISLGNEVYREGVDITLDQFMRKLQRTSSLPASLPPSLKTMEDIYARLIRETEEIIGIYISRKLNPVLEVAQEASTPFLGRARILAVDSLTTSLGLGILVTAAARAAAQGQPVDEIVRLVRGMIPHIYLVAFTENLKYLERSGCISKSQAILGTMLGIKPFLTMENGQFIPLEKVQTEEQMAEKLFEFIAEFSRIEKIALLQNGFQEASTLLLEKVKATFPKLEVLRLPYNPSLICHLGPRALSLIVYEGM